MITSTSLRGWFRVAVLGAGLVGPRFVAYPAERAGATPATVAPAVPASGAPAPSAGAAPTTWKELATPGYADYLNRLRAAGCPEDRIRLVVGADASEWQLQERIREAVAGDFPWWKAEPPLTGGERLNDKFDQLRKRRAELVAQLVGTLPGEAEEPSKDVPVVVNLSGPVLGALSREKFNAVQEICGRSLDRHQGYFNNRQNEGVFLNQGDLARLREQTRADLATVLSEEELEEFLLRYSHNANRLRVELAALEPSPDEFRQIFRAVDSLEHRLQLEYGALDSLSSRQREDFERQREEAIRKLLTPERYQRYLVGRYPLFRQAQLLVRRAGLPEGVTLAFYQVLQDHESRRREVLNNSGISGEQRQLALQTIERDRETGLRKVLGEEGYKQYRDSLVN